MQIALLALLLCLPAGNAFADPVSLALAAATAASQIFTLPTLGSLALSFGLSYVAGKLLEKPSDITPRRAPVGGVKIDVTVDANVPRSLLVGTAATAGSLVFADTYGRRDRTQNSDLLAFYAIADHPCQELVDVWINGKNEPYAANPSDVEAGTDEGMRVTDYNNKLFFKFYDGTQTTADALAIAKLTTTPAWTSNHIGHGITYVRAHAIFHPTRLTSPPEWKFIVKGIKLYDPRKDTTAGGSGSHRFTTLSTHEWTENPMVIAYNILRGIYVADGSGVRQHFYGLKRATSAHLPFAAWAAAMNACDQGTSPTDLTERYRAGGEIPVDTEPHEAIKELLKCCGGRIEELGGVFTPYVDAPEIPVAEFTDDDILDQEDVFSVVLPLEQRVNHITVKFTTPLYYNEKECPAITKTEYETEDGRRLPAELNVPMVQSPKQAQRLGWQFLKRARRGRKWKVSLPPRFFSVEAGQIVSCNSTRNGFVDKEWEVDAVEYHGNLAVTWALTEIDPTDYDWDEDDLLDEDDDHVDRPRPNPKTVVGFAVLAVTETGADGTKKPGIKLTWSAPLDADIQRLVYQIRRPSIPGSVYTGDHNDPEDGAVVATQGLHPKTTYEVRARYDSRRADDVNWTSWLSVTTTNAKVGVVDLDDAIKFEITTGINQRIADVRTSLNLLSGVVAELEAGVDLDIKTLTTQLVNTKNQITTAYKSAIAAAVGPDSAIGRALESLESQVDGIKASVKAQFVTAVKPNFAIAAYELLLTAEKAKAGMTLIARSIGGQRVGQVWFDADHFMVGKTGDDGSFRPPFVISNVGGKARILIDGTVIAESIRAAEGAFGSITSPFANLGTVTAGNVIFENTAGRIEITSKPPRILISERV